ncbi:hypothetical protein FGRMN_6214 [Fusarium graminum]|nr:hypothetical protein FGRMN_6214 [Fusarium graminum]
MLMYTPDLGYCIEPQDWWRIRSRVFEDAVLLLATGTGFSRIFKHIYRDFRPAYRYKGFLEMRDLDIIELIHPGFLRQQGEHFNARVALNREESLAMSSVMLGQEYRSKQPMPCGATALPMAIMAGNRDIVDLIHIDDRHPGVDCTLALEVWATRSQSQSPKLIFSCDDAPDTTYLNGLDHRLLQEADVNVRCCSDQEFTPLMIACGDPIEPGTFVTLLEHGADPCLTGQLNFTAMFVSVLQCLLQGFSELEKIARRWFNKEELERPRLPQGHSSLECRHLPRPLVETTEQK